MNQRADEQDIPSPRRILVVKLADMGDALLATPAIRSLRQTFRTATIDALVAPAGAPILGLCPDLDRVIVFGKSAFDSPAGLLQPRSLWSLAALTAQLRLRRYDTVVLLHHLTSRFGALKFRALVTSTGAGTRAGLDNGRGDFLTHRAADLGYGGMPELDYGLQVVKSLGAVETSRQPSIEIPSTDRQRAEDLLRSRGVTGPFVVIHPSVGGYSPARNWDPDRFGVVAHGLATRRGLQVVVVGGNDAREAARIVATHHDVVDLVGLTTVGELAALLSRASLVIGSDSGVPHLAAAVGAPTLAIFGPSNHHAWQPYGAAQFDIGTDRLPDSRVLIVRADIPCSPCFYSGYSLGRRNGCALRTCLSLIPAAAVTEIAITLASRNSTPN